MRCLAVALLCAVGTSCGDDPLSVPADLGQQALCEVGCPLGSRCTVEGCVAEPDLGSPCGANTDCSGQCVNLGTNPAHCGGCGLACASHDHVFPECGGGVCNGTCVAGFADCDRDKRSNGCEVDVLVDPNNCGRGGATGPTLEDGQQGAGCGVSCPTLGMLNMNTRSCSEGICNGNCALKYADCNGDKLKDGCETRVIDDPMNCGVGGATGVVGADGLPGLGCGVVCSSNNIVAPSCAAGICNGYCTGGFADCDGDKLTNGCEQAVHNDPDNCGLGGAGGPIEPGGQGPQGLGCGVVCSKRNMQTRTCLGGVCEGVCMPGFGDCDKNKQTNGCESDLRYTYNCGGCGILCAAPLGCLNYQCVPCVGGLTYCAGYCEDLANDPINCGACGKVCPANLSHCRNGMCEM